MFLVLVLYGGVLVGISLIPYLVVLYSTIL